MRRAISSLALASLLLAGDNALAFTTLDTCGAGAPRRVKNLDGSQPSNLTVYYDTVSMPSGSAYYNALSNALARWADVPGAAGIWVNKVGSYPSLTDNYSDAWVEAMTDPGARGQTYLTTYESGVYTHQTNPMLFLTGSCHIVAADVQMVPASSAFTFNLPYHPDAPGQLGLSQAYNLGYAVALHEWGHAHGLLHNFEAPPTVDDTTMFSVMNGANAGPLPLMGSAVNLGWGWIRDTYSTAPTQDDGDGLRYLYPDGTTQGDIAASAQELQDEGSPAWPKWQVGSIRHGFTGGLCRGVRPTFRITSENTGTTWGVNTVSRLHLSTSASGYQRGSGIEIHRSSGITASTWSRDAQVLIPCCTPPATYYVYLDVDTNNASTGTDVNDVVRFTDPLPVANCQTSACAGVICP